MENMSEKISFEWGECPICKTPVTGTIEYVQRDSWIDGHGLCGEQPYDTPPSCQNGCPLKNFAPRLTGLNANDEDGMKSEVRKTWAEMLDTVSHVTPCVCGGTPVMTEDGRSLTCLNCGNRGISAYNTVDTVGNWNDYMADLEKTKAEEQGRTRLYAILGGKVEAAPNPLDPGQVENGTDVLAVWDNLDGHHEKRGLWPFSCPSTATLFDPDTVHAHRWKLSDGTFITSMDAWQEPRHGEVSQNISTLTGHRIILPNMNVIYVAD